MEFRRTQTLALSATVFTISCPTFALEPLADDDLRRVYGQEGISIDQDYRTTIETIEYIDGDGDGSGQSGSIIIRNLSFGNDTGTDFGDNTATTEGRIQINNARIDALDTGVQITAGDTGLVGDVLINDSAQNTDAPITDASGFFTDPVSGQAIELRYLGDATETHIAAIEVGKSDGSGTGALGGLHIINQGNYFSSYAAHIANNRFGMDLDMTDTNRYLNGKTIVSATDNGTGVSLVTEAAAFTQALYYEDTDSPSGNQLGLLEMSSFRLVENDDVNDVNAGGTGTHIRGARTALDLNVIDGKIVLSNMTTDSSTIINKIYIGDAQAAYENNQGVIGGIAIINNHWQGTMRIYAHD